MTPIQYKCICKGNLRKLITETTPEYGKNFVLDGMELTLKGILGAIDDYYFLFNDSKNNVILASCSLKLGSYIKQWKN